ncbi:MAG: helix-turn-helix domain-containing protein [Acidimicrobiia bacterium]|nr:helix-turn-helix domain-containing protein [Acidimicrobiia bacterium]NNL97752.1 helix-turn-helix domain-containing protein [Acidimicrobiia bacterium]
MDIYRTEYPEEFGTEELAQLLLVPLSTARKLVREQNIPVTKQGRAFRFRMDDVMAWCRERQLERARLAS